ncbi:MAG TPA: helix-turn-helix domain-containing protein [Woeseiaceae bacterium]|nr:helix-turn-helix domain-containing protein [Woeseiaceae bacterium]
MTATLIGLPGVGGVLREEVEALGSALIEAVLAEVPAFTASGNPDIVPELKAHLDEQLAEVCRLLSGRAPGDLAFVLEHARRCAEQKFPLDAVLASYRCLHRLLADAVREAAIQSADESAQLRRVVAAAHEFANEYCSGVSSLMTSEYVLQTRILAEAEGDQRSALMNTLLRGYDESDSRAAQLLRRAGYLEQRQSYCVVVARSVDPREMENAPRAQRMIDSVGHALRNVPIRVLIGMNDNLVTAVVSGTRRLSGWTAPQSLLADRIYEPLRTIGPAALIGVSTDKPSTTHIPSALKEAKLALNFASVAARVMHYSRIPFRDMLVRVASEQIRPALPVWVDTFLAANEKSRGALANTLRAYADNDMNALRTAKALSLHPNTVYARMQRINDITGRNPLTYNALTELLLATDCAILDR